MQPQEIIRQALELLRKDGWCVRELENSKGQRCAWGAINKVALGRADTHHNIDEDSDYSKALSLLAHHIPADFDHEYTDDIIRLVHYNNSRKDLSEIETWFEKAAADERIN